MGKNKRFVTLVFLVLGFAFSNIEFLYAQQGEIKLGAYYFDGWSGKNPNHITNELKTTFSNREPKWGWITSSQRFVDDQIRVAAEKGIKFFNFCWYPDLHIKQQPLNNALGFYLSSNYRNQIDFCLLIANHKGQEITPEDWEALTDKWIKLFKFESYLKVDSCPLITFFSMSTLLEKFGSTGKVKSAFFSFRSKVEAAGFKGLKIALCTAPVDKDLQNASACGFDILTGYNYHGFGLRGRGKKVDVGNMTLAEDSIWTEFTQKTNIPIIPTMTINWDPRPWAKPNNDYGNAPYFVGFSAKSVYNSILSCRKWMMTNAKFTTNEKLAIIYAWNEYGEGAYLTPTKDGFDPLSKVSKALKRSLK